MLKTYDTVELASISKDSNNDLDYIKHFKSSSLKYTQSGVNKVDSTIQQTTTVVIGIFHDQ